MVRRLGELNEEFVSAAKEYYLRGMEIDTIAAKSEELLGQEIDKYRLRTLCVEGKWSLERKKTGVNDDDIKYQVDAVRNIVFNQIKSESESGLKITFDTQEQRDTLIDFLNEQEIQYSDFSPKGVDPQLVNAFMGLLTRSKDAGIENLGKTAKTSRQQVLEAARKVIEEGKQS